MLESVHVDIKCKCKASVSQLKNHLPLSKEKASFPISSTLSGLSPGVQSSGNAAIYIWPKVHRGLKYPHASFKERFCMLAAAPQPVTF